MPDHDPLAGWYAAIKSGDEAALRSAVTDDVFVLWNGDPARIPWAGRHDGIEAVGQFFRTLSHHVEVLSVTPVERFDGAGATIVIVEGRWRIRDTETVIAARACNLFRLRDGRVSGYEVYNDTAPFAEALAAAPR